MREQVGCIKRIEDVIEEGINRLQLLEEITKSIKKDLEDFKLEIYNQLWKKDKYVQGLDKYYIPQHITKTGDID